MIQKKLLFMVVLATLISCNQKKATDKKNSKGLQLPTYEEKYPLFHTYKNPTSKDGVPLLAITAEENDNADFDDFIIIQKRADDLCESLGHKEARAVSGNDVQYGFEGKAYFDGKIIHAETKLDAWTAFTLMFIPVTHSNAIFKALRCTD